MYKEVKLGEVQETMLFRKSVFDRKLFSLFFLLQQQFHKSGIQVPVRLSRSKGLYPVHIIRKICDVQIGKATSFSQNFCFPLWISIRHYSIFIFILKLLYSEGRAGKAFLSQGT
jgi:hypothetical protein